MAKTGKYFIAAIGILIAGLIIWYFSNIIAYILIAFVLSLIGHPLVSLIDRIKISKFVIPKPLNAFISLALIWTLIFTFFRIFVPIVADEAQELSSINTEVLQKSLEEPLKSAENWYLEISNKTGAKSINFEEYVTNKIVAFLNVSDLSKIFQTITGLLGDIFVAFFAISFITFFFLKDEKLFVNSLVLIIPEKYEDNVIHALSSIKRLLSRYFIGIIIDVSIMITLITIGLNIVGIELRHALVIGLFMGMLNVIPYVGPVLGGAFGLLVGILTNIEMHFYTELMPLLGFMLLVFITVQVIDATLIQPTIFSNSVNAHPLEIFLVILTAGSLAGIAGMILAIPSYTILRVIAKEFFNKFRVVKKLTEKISD